MAKPGLSYERHVEIGQQLFEMQEELTHLVTEIDNAYPLSARYSIAIRRAASALSGARSEGDSQLARDHRDQFDPAVYYGDSRRRSEQR